jgi:hypothetical protein
MTANREESLAEVIRQLVVERRIAARQSLPQARLERHYCVVKFFARSGRLKRRQCHVLKGRRAGNFR